MLTVVAEICVKPGRRQEVLEAINKLIPVVLEEEGCHQYDALVDHAGAVEAELARLDLYARAVGIAAPSGAASADAAHGCAPRHHQR